MGKGIEIIRLAVLVLIASASVSVCLAGVHDGGVGACNHCHIMHSDEVGVIGNEALLLASSPAELCLGCHADALGSVLGADPQAPPAERGPGNFVFLLEDNLNDGPDGTVNPVSGDAAGHNLNAPGYGLMPDPTYVTSPGGNYSSADMTCTSCHDPHGNQNYRFLYGAGVQSGSGVTFSYPAPTAVGLDLVLGGSESNSNHVAYRGGMSQWCGNCHGDYLTSRHRVFDFKHGTDSTLKNGHVNTYNAYNGTLDPTGGNAVTAYLTAVPFEDASSTVNSTQGPTTVSRLTCLTCHRAHGSSAPHSGRWDFNVTHLGDDGIVSGSYAIPNPYFDPGQDKLCFKCHKNIPGLVIAP